MCSCCWATATARSSPYREADQAVELAVADLTGNGSKPTSSTPTRGSTAWSSSTAPARPTVLGDQSTGLLDPGAVALADLNGDGIPDLIVANSGSNNVLVYPGLGNGQFGPAINGGQWLLRRHQPGRDHRRQPQDGLPDLVVADKGSNDVSILLNQSQGGGTSRSRQGPRLNSGGIGPVSTVVGNFTGGAYPDILVTNSGSNDVALLPGVGRGSSTTTNPPTFSVGHRPR